MAKVTQLINARGNPAANHFVIQCADGAQVLQSYQSFVARKHGSKITLGLDWDYSPTTLKHVKIFLGISLSKADIQKRINAGEIEVREFDAE